MSKVKDYQIGIYTPELSTHVSGGILCICETLNKLVEKGYDCVCFVDNPPYRSDWLETKFPVKSSSEIEKFDGLLISPFSPTAGKVCECKSARDRFYWVHTNESLFVHNGYDWQSRAKQSYSFPLKIFCTSIYLQIIMETIFNRYVIGQVVPPGIDPGVFYPASKEKIDRPLKVGVLYRTDWVRGHDVALGSIELAKQRGANIERVDFGGIRDRSVMANIMRSLDVYLDMSRVAGSPTPVIESMACGAIPVCTKYGTTDFILSNFNGYIASTDNVKEVSEILCMLSEMSDEQIIQLSSMAANIGLRRSWNWVADMFIDALQEGLDRGDELLEFRSW